jgi:hypothetical protein
MVNQSDKITSKTWIGWALTIILSIVGAWTSMSSRVYSTESQIRLLELRVSAVEKGYDKQLENMVKLNEQYNEIKQSLIRIEGVLNTKADKQYRQ